MTGSLFSLSKETFKLSGRRRKAISLAAVRGFSRRCRVRNGLAISPRIPSWLVATEGIDDVSRFFGIRWDAADTARFTVRPDLINAGGLLSGVATYALVDYTMGSALWAQTSDEESIATVSIAINYVQTATEGEAVCETQVDRRNRTSAVLRSEVRHEDGRLLATAIGSYAIYPRRRR
jgi:uncharacterized protein (TIGR00369 family)